MGLFNSLSYGICGGKSCYIEGPVTTGLFFCPPQGIGGCISGVFGIKLGRILADYMEGVSVYVGVL